jgi:hypothetical protein
MTAQGYFTRDKAWVPQGDLEAIKSDGTTPEPVNRSQNHESASRVAPFQHISVVDSKFGGVRITRYWHAFLAAGARILESQISF